tara:strand:- start:1913 stop:2128 length:216 start_codon:yes stop_codon:yes gene_type:complete
MPFYNWHCTKCDMVFEIFQTMTERDQEPPTHCEDCDPQLKEEGTLRQVHFKGSLPKFKVKGDGAYYPDKMQ